MKWNIALVLCALALLAMPAIAAAPDVTEIDNTAALNDLSAQVAQLRADMQSEFAYQNARLEAIYNASIDPSADYATQGLIHQEAETTRKQVSQDTSPYPLMVVVVCSVAFGMALVKVFELLFIKR